MEPENRVNICEKPPIEVEVKTSNGRRKLIRGALAGAPILLALKSSPVLACNCKLPSGFSASGNLSRNNGFACTQPAHSPSYWPNHIDTNNCFSGTGGVSKATKFKNVFGGNDTRTLLEVLNSGTNFPSLVVSAYLGIKASYFVSGISIQNIKDMWNGLYRPTGSGNYWSPTENENYLRYTMGLPTVQLFDGLLVYIMHWRQASPGSFFWKEVDEGWICYDQRSGNTRLFSPLARFISDLFEQNSSPLACSEIIDEVMRAEPDADLDECRVEVEAVLRILSEAHLILPVQP